MVERVVLVPAQPATFLDLLCPRCAVPLLENTVGTSVLHGCPTCYGVWLPRAEVERLLRERDREILERVRKMAGVVLPGVNLSAHIGCVVCRQTLRRVAIPDSIRGLDVCDEHGVWFDWDDLPVFVHACEEWRSGTFSDDDLHVSGLPRRKSVRDDEAVDPAWVKQVLRPRA